MRDGLWVENYYEHFRDTVRIGLTLQRDGVDVFRNIELCQVNIIYRFVKSKNSES